MDKHPVAWGLDIGSSSIKAVKLARAGTTVTVMGYTIEPIIVTEDGNREEAVVKAINSMALREDFGSAPVLACLSGRQVLTRTVNIPTLNAKKLDRMVELEARQQIPGNFDEIEWGYHLSPASDGASNDVALFAVKRDLVEELISKSKQSGINLIGVSVSSLALYNFVRYDQVFPDDEAVIILDVGAENTDLVVYQGESLWMRTLAVSGNDITRAFMKKFKVSFEEAETLKRQTPDSRQAEKIIRVIEGSLNELTAEVQRSLGFYKSQNTSAKLENLVISGSTFKLPGLPQYMADKLHYTVNILEDLDKIKVAGGLDREHFLSDLPALGVSVGLALQATGVSQANVNLMPGQLQVQNLLNSKRWAAIAIIALLGIAYGVSYSAIKSVMDENIVLADRMKSADKATDDKLAVTNSYLSAVAPAAARLAQYDCYGAQSGVLSSVLASVTDAVGGLIQAGGAIGDQKPIGDGGDPYLQRYYLDEISLTQGDSTRDAIFHPYRTPRVVSVKIKIVKQDNHDVLGIMKQIQARLEALPAGADAKGRALFASVRCSDQSTPPPDNYHYVDTEWIDDKTGSQTGRHDNRPIKIVEVTYECSLPLEGAQ